MGGTKRMMEAQDDLDGIALGICIKAGVISECEFHPGSYYEGSGEVEEAYKLANARITSRVLELPDGFSRRDLTDAIKDAHEENSGLEQCGSCQRVFERD